MTNEYPKLRPIQTVPVMVNDEIMIGLRDPHDLSETGSQMVVMTKEALQVVSLFDGTNSITDIQTVLTRLMGGVLFPREHLDDMVAMLDRHFLIESDRYRQVLSAYRDAKVRKGILPGYNLPGEPGQLAELLNRVMSEATAELPDQPVRAIIAPHIDVFRGSAAFAESYRALATNHEAQIFVVLGTSHYADTNTRFAFTRKDYETPWGCVPVCQEFVNRVAQKSSQDILADEILHKGEHSIEFAALFLHHTIGKSRPIQIVPILVGSFHDCIENQQSPRDVKAIAELLAAISATATEMGRERIAWIASGDLSHVGQKFGDETTPDEFLLSRVRMADMECLEAAQNGDAEVFFAKLAAHRNQFRVCGASPIYALLDALKPERVTGKLLRYDQSQESETDSVVTLASLSFTQNGAT